MNFLSSASASALLASLALLLGSSASAQVGAPRAALTQLPALSSFKPLGTALVAPDGSRITLTMRGNTVLAAQVDLSKNDPVQAGKLLGALTGYGDGLAQAYTDYLKDPQKQAALQAGNTIGAQQFQVTQKLSGNKLRFTVSLPEVPANQFAATKNAKGPATARVVLRLYSDFQCPFCEKFETETWPALQKALGNTVRYEFHQFPLEQIHPNARAAAEASECAAQQGQFWAFHDTLFDPQNWQKWTQATNPNPSFIAYAGSLKLKPADFKECLAERSGKANVDAGIKEALDIGVNGTPTLFVNGFKVMNPYDVKDVMKMVQMVQGK